MALATFWEIAFKSEGDYKSYDQMVQGALNDDCYQKIYPGIASEILLENLIKFVQDVNNTPTKDGVDHGTLYKKANGRQIDSSRRYYLVKESNLDEFNLYVKITKGRNLGYYRLYENRDEVEMLLQFGLNYLKRQATLPIVADYFLFAQDSRYFFARERCEFISRLLHNNVVGTKNPIKVDYDVKELGSRKCPMQQKSKPASAPFVRNKKQSRSKSRSTERCQSISRKRSQSISRKRSQSISPERSRSISPERSQSISPERSQSPSPMKHVKNKLVKKQHQRLSKSIKKKTTAASTCAATSTTETSIVNQKKKSNGTSSNLVTRSTPILNRLRAKPNGRAVVASSPTLSTRIVPAAAKSKNKNFVSGKKRGYSSEDEKVAASGRVTSISTTTNDVNLGKNTNGRGKSKRIKI